MNREPARRGAVRRRLGAILALGIVAAAFPGCGDGREVRVYCALDRNFAEPILKEFERTTGIRVRDAYDIESTKTVGLVQSIENEARRPVCDVFWNNEILHTIRLKRLGLLESYASPSAAGLPAQFVDVDHQWHGFAARARVLIVNTDLMPDKASWPRNTFDLVDARFSGRGAIAKPLTGTTMTHVVALFGVLGADKTHAFLDGLFANDVTLTSGNAHVMKLVRDGGSAAFGFTDTDDYNVARAGGFAVASVYPDQDGIGTLLIPNTVAIVKGAPHRTEAERLIDYLLSAPVEEALAKCDSAQIPLRPGVKVPEHVRMPDTFKVMQVDWDRVADAFDQEQDALRARFVTDK